MDFRPPIPRLHASLRGTVRLGTAPTATEAWLIACLKILPHNQLEDRLRLLPSFRQLEMKRRFVATAFSLYGSTIIHPQQVTSEIEARIRRVENGLVHATVIGNMLSFETLITLLPSAGCNTPRSLGRYLRARTDGSRPTAKI